MRPKWTLYRPKNPVKCDDCMLVLAQAKGVAPPARTARWKRRSGDVDRLLCGAHAQQRRHDDGLPKLKDVTA